jgi:hypothetical protein
MIYILPVLLMIGVTEKELHPNRKAEKFAGRKGQRYCRLYRKGNRSRASWG